MDYDSAASPSPSKKSNLDSIQEQREERVNEFSEEVSQQR